jgi:hypothetical protein
MKPICVPCERFYRPKKNGFSFLEGMPKSNQAPSGKEHSDLWDDYKLWHGDLWQCPGCSHQIIVGVGSGPISEHYLPDFAGRVKSFAPAFRVNDC